MFQLSFPEHGGRRKGAGRKPNGRVTHHGRQQFGRVLPSHVTLRIQQGLPSLRSSRNFAAVRDALRAARGRNGLRLIEFAVLGNHLHLIVEVDDSAALSRGMQGLCIRIARALNRVLRRAGRLFDDHYHSHLLRSPRELLNAINYVLGNAAKHFGARDPADAYSSIAPDSLEALCAPRGWLVRTFSGRSFSGP